MATAWARKDLAVISNPSSIVRSIFAGYRENALVYAGIFVLYFAINIFSSYMYHIAGTAPAVILAPQGISLAAALMYGYRVIPVTALATFIVALYAGNPLILALLALMANIAQPTFTLFTLDLLKVDRLLKNTWDFYVFMATATITTSIVPTLNVLGRILYNNAAAQPIHSLVWSNLWIAGLLSALILTPLLVRLLRPSRSYSRSEWLENSAIIFALNIPTAVLTYTPATAILGINLLIPFCLLLMWIALRGGTFFITLAMLTVSISAVSGRILGHPANPQNLDLPAQIVSAELSLIIFTILFYFIAALEENRRAANQQLQSYAKDLEKVVAEQNVAAAAKNEFIAILGHELRNPLAPIVSSVELLRQPDIDHTEAKQLIDVIGHQAEQLTALLRDLLDVSRIMRGNVHLSLQQVNIQDIVSHAMTAVKPSLQEAKHHISIAMPTDAIVLQADPVRVEQILVNLLDNASKYTDAGGEITVSVALEEKNISVSVQDSGIGIPREMHDRIFDPFVQLRDSKSMSNGGLGIGLMLSRNLARLHGGDLSVASAGTGHGSQFTLTLPLPRHTSLPSIE